MFTYKDIAHLLSPDERIIGEISAIHFNAANTIEDCHEQSIVWLSEAKSKQQDLVDQLKANVVIAHSFIEQISTRPSNIVFITSPNPKALFIKILNSLFVKKPESGIHPTSIIHPEASIGARATIGAFCVIGNVQIGEDVEIHSHVVIHDQSKLGNRVLVKSHSTIGSDGFGYSKTPDGHFEKFPHLGGVIIGNDVEIGSNTCIDRGTLGNTIIKDYAKIDNLVHVAHNVEIGKNTLVIANVLIGGSTKIGDNCWIAPSATLRDGLYICDDVIVGMSAVVTKNLTEPGIYLGNPARIKT